MSGLTRLPPLLAIALLLALVKTATAVNAAPVLNTSGITYLGTNAMVPGAAHGAQVEDVLSASFNGGTAPITDSDPGASRGIAIVGADTSNGSWQYYLGSSSDTHQRTRITFPSGLDDRHALLLAAVSDAVSHLDVIAVVFVGNPGFRGHATFTYRAWDQSLLDGAQQSGSVVDVSVNGGTTPFSTGVRTAMIAIHDTPPVIDTFPKSLPSLVEDTPSGAIDGVTLQSLYGATWSDLDAGDRRGVAIIAADNVHGTWQYTTDNARGAASSWHDVGEVTSNQALLLHFADSATGFTNAAVRFVPAPDFSVPAGSPQTVQPTLYLEGWDEFVGVSSTDGARSTYDVAADHAQIDTPGSFSSPASPIQVWVQPVNDAPMLATAGQSEIGNFANSQFGTPPVTLTVLVDAAHNGGQAPIFDADAPDDPFRGIAIIAADSSNGTWQYRIGTTAGFATIPMDGQPGAVSPTDALLLAVGQFRSGLSLPIEAAIRFVPRAGFAGTATFTYRAWDQTSAEGVGSSGSRGDSTLNGGATAFSVGVRTAVVSIFIPDSRPVLALSGIQDLGNVTNAVDGPVRSLRVADLLSPAMNGGLDPFTDADHDVLGIAVVGAPLPDLGTWEYSVGGQGFVPFPAVNIGSGLLLEPGSTLRFVPNGANSGLAQLIFKAWDRTDGHVTGDRVATFALPFSQSTRTAQMNVVASGMVEVTDASPTGLQGLAAALLAPGSQVLIDPASIRYTGTTAIGGAQAAFLTAIDLGTATDGTRMTLPGRGLLLTTGDGTPAAANADAAALATGRSASIDLGGGGDADLAALVPGETLQDACSLSFSFTVPAGTTAITFQTMFGSESLPLLTGEAASDIAAVLVDGVNSAVLGSDPRAVLRADAQVSAVCARNETGSPLASEYNGLTRPATVTALLDPRLSVHTIKFAVADTGGGAADSGLFIAAFAGSNASADVGIPAPVGGGTATSSGGRGCGPGSGLVALSVLALMGLRRRMRADAT
ncbi:MAG: choice-of-anchor L domain-containing protein [Planctomycetes bacterium]|nr:choice-of-anchor L domain-containing protein [Planctomycetota bacterium]